MAPAIERLPDDPKQLKAMLLAERARNQRLVQIIKEMQQGRASPDRRRFLRAARHCAGAVLFLVTRHPKYACRACEGAVVLCLGVQFMR
jgi:hypothetical protein